MERPKLRKGERSTLLRGEERLLVLRDPLEIAEPMAVDEEYAAVLDLLDGARTLPQIRQSLRMRLGMDAPLEDLAQFRDDLEDAGWLEGERFEATWREIHEAFMAADAHAPAFAGIHYPDDADELAVALADAVPPVAERDASGKDTLGLVTPYLPLTLTAELLRATLRYLPPAHEVDTVLLLGTDHLPGLLPFAASDRPHGTPLGQAPLAEALLAELDERLDWILREEIRHRNASSLELASLLLLAAYGDACPPTLAIQCGQNAIGPRGERGATEEFLATMEAVLPRHGRVLVWASAELSHVGEGYGDAPLDAEALLRVAERDRDRLLPLLAGQPDRFERACDDPAARRDRLSGAAALSTLARLLPVGTRGEVTRYVPTRPPGASLSMVGAVGLRFQPSRAHGESSSPGPVQRRSRDR